MDPFIKGLPPIFMIMLPAWDYWKPDDPGIKGPLKEPLPICKMLSTSR